jgi:hypothetical protein
MGKKYRRNFEKKLISFQGTSYTISEGRVVFSSTEKARE